MVQQQAEQTQRRQRPRPTYRTVQVQRINRITPHMVRITVSGQEMEGFASRGPAEHIKVFFPKQGEERPVLPVWGPDGPLYAEGQERPISRTYTPVSWNPDTLELEIDFLIHGDGPGATWALHAKEGDFVAIGGPGGPYNLDTEAPWHLIAGDAAALPAVATILKALPASTQAKVYVEVQDAAEEQELESPAQLEVTWLHRGGQTANVGVLLEDALRNAELPEGDGKVWVGCEANVMRTIRKHFRDERGLDSGSLHTQGYWKQGATNHPDHDLGQDD